MWINILSPVHEGDAHFFFLSTLNYIFFFFKLIYIKRHYSSISIILSALVLAHVSTAASIRNKQPTSDLDGVVDVVLDYVVMDFGEEADPVVAGYDDTGIDLR